MDELKTQEEIINNKILKGTRIEFYDQLNYCGIYFLINRNEIVYIGSSKNIGSRILSHQKENIKEFDSLSFIICKREELLSLESLYILHFQPKYNKYVDSEQLIKVGLISSILLKNLCKAQKIKNGKFVYQLIKKRKTSEIKYFTMNKIFYYKIEDVMGIAKTFYLIQNNKRMDEILLEAIQEIKDKIRKFVSNYQTNDNEQYYKTAHYEKPLPRFHIFSCSKPLKFNYGIYIKQVYNNPLHIAKYNKKFAQVFGIENSIFLSALMEMEEIYHKFTNKNHPQNLDNTWFTFNQSIVVSNHSLSIEFQNKSILFFTNQEILNDDYVRILDTIKIDDQIYYRINYDIVSVVLEIIDKNNDLLDVI